MYICSMYNKIEKRKYQREPTMNETKEHQNEQQNMYKMKEKIYKKIYLCFEWSRYLVQ